MPIRNIESPYGGGVQSLPGPSGNRLPVMFPTAPVLPANGPQLGSSRVAVVRVDETPAGDASGPECPRAEQNWQRPIDLSEVAENVCPALPAGGSPLAGLVNSVGPVGPCAILSLYAEKTPEPLEHMVLLQADPAGQPSAVGTLSPSDCYHVDPADPYVAGGPCRPSCLFYRSEFVDAYGSDTC